MLGKFNEDEIRKFCNEIWKRDEPYKFSEGKKGEIYSIDTPPPFTSGTLHMGHVVSYSFFDFVARYKRMKGYDVFYPQGWDTQGFPTEVKVEKKYGRLPRREFVEKCKDWTEKCIENMKAQMQKLGFSPDWRFEYRTLDPEYHKKVQLSLIKMYEKGMVKRKRHAVYWCTSCGSAIAKAETEEKEREGILNYITFESEEGEKVEIATTRPELMHACVAVMYNPEDNRYKFLKGKKVKTALGKEVPVIEDKDVKMEFGTGLLMVCTFGDIQDLVWINRHGLPVMEAITKEGRIASGEFKEMKVKDAREKIIEKLKKEGKITRQERLRQVVKVHDRCKKEIELLESMQWFAEITPYKEQIRRIAEEVRWVPEFAIHHLYNWMETLEWEWCISRNRVFGTPLPFYYCERCEWTESAEENELPFYPENSKEKICEKCGGKMKPEEMVADCWIDSSITPLVISGWPSDEYEKKYPNSLRPQGVEIIRTWAFYTIYRCWALTGKKPWETILLNGNVLAPDGRKMSKSLGNVISPEELMKEYPVDAIRQWAALSGVMAKDRPFSYEDLKRSKAFCIKLWNASRFVERAAERKEEEDKKEKMFTDMWILWRMNETVKKTTDHLEQFEFHHALSEIQEFFWSDFCDNYLEMVKHRIYSGENKSSAQRTLIEVMENTLKLLAPFMPFETEYLWFKLLGKEKSIHSSEWPKYVEGKFDKEEEMGEFLRLLSEIRRRKSAEGISLGREVDKMELESEMEIPEAWVSELEKVGKVRKIVLVKSKTN